MMRTMLLVAAFLIASGTAAFAQVAEVGISGGVSRFNGAELLSDPEVTLDDGFRLGVRLTLNTYRFFGHEIGYSYNRSGINISGPEGGSMGMSIHQFGYGFLAYATPEGSRFRPFAIGGVHFTSFFPPGADVYYGNQVTKFGFNYGGGLKATVTEVWGVRFDIRQFNTGKPDLFQTPQGPSGRLKQTEISAGVSFNL